MLPRTLGRYEVTAVLGHGGMGSVYRARDPRIGRDVAIKLLREGYDNPELRDRFAREARSAGSLSHPNIVTIYDVGEQDGVAYIAMELLEGKSLQQILRETPRLPIATIADLAAQVADGLDLAQRYKITHRDIPK
jgi:serine/threonine-protein kinase